MWPRRFLIFLVSVVLLGSVLWKLLPQHWFKQGGKLELGILIDWSGSNEENFPVAVQGAEEVTRYVLPCDRLAVYAVGPEVNELYKGTVASPKVLELVRRQIHTLQVSTRQGTALREGFEKVGEAFEEFTLQYNQHRTSRRVLVVFSDGKNVPTHEQAANLSGVELPGGMTVLIIGFKGIAKDQVTQVLQGEGGSNDVHIVPTEEAEQAIDALRKTMRRAHPFNISTCVAVLLSCLLSGLVTAVLVVRPPKSEGGWEVLLTRVGADETDWEWEKRSPIQLQKGQSITVSSHPDATCFCEVDGLGFEIRSDGTPMIAPLPANEKSLQIQETSGSVTYLGASQTLPLPRQVTLLVDGQPVYDITVCPKGGR